MTLGATETVNRSTIEEIYDCARLWRSADADHPDTPSREWQAALRLCQQAPSMLDELELLADLIEEFYGGKWSAMTEVERFALKRVRALLSAAKDT